MPVASSSHRLALRKVVPMSHSVSRSGFAVAAPAAPHPRSHERAAELVGGYPDLSRAQLDELAAIFPRLKAVDVALMMADKRLAPRLDAFCAANRELMAPSLSDYLVIAAIMAFPAVALLAVVIAQ
jgi:hypothetical protein